MVAAMDTIKSISYKSTTSSADELLEHDYRGFCKKLICEPHFFKKMVPKSQIKNRSWASCGSHDTWRPAIGSIFFLEQKKSKKNKSLRTPKRFYR